MADADRGMPAATHTEGRLRIELDLRTVVVVIAVLLGAAALIGLARAADQQLTWIGIGAVLALALNPLVVAVQQRLRARRVFAVLAVGGGFLAVALLVAVVMGPPAIRQAQKFSDELPRTVEEMYDFPIIGSRLEDADAAQKVREWAADLPSRLDDETISNLIDSVVGGLLATGVVMLVTFTLLLDGEAVVHRLHRVFPPSRRPQADKVGRVFYRVFGRYFAGSLLVALIAGAVILAIGLALGVPLTPVAAIWMVLVDLIPQIGGLLGGVVFVTLAVTKDVQTGVICLALYAVYNLVENHVLQPAIVGESVNLSPPTTMMAAIIGGAAAGVPGALIATPLVGTAKVLYLELRGRSPKLDEGAPGLRHLLARFRRHKAA